ncbi:hypothetical protein [Streptomyces sp. NPDC089799]|uniref:hypothetical protein n=1 Tax=Streptomyces sp. NPDC089799 TaxID=3155066 RepID=UPI003420265E
MPAELPEKWQQVAPEPVGRTSPASPGTTDLQHSPKPWTTAALTASDLRFSTDAAITGLARAHEGLSEHTRGLGAALALDGVRHSWETRLKAVRDECAGLSEILKGVALTLGELDREIGGQFTRIRHTAARD